MSNSHQLTTDLCVVCRDHHVLKGSIYCGRDCRTLAYNYRKRLAPVVAHLKRLNFVCWYENGTQLFMTIPINVAYAYPSTLRVCTFPEVERAEQPLDDLNADQLWMSIMLHFGVLVGAFTRWLLDRGIAETDMLLELFRFHVQSVMHEGRTKVCDKCHNRFIYSRETFPDVGDTCADCLETEMEHTF